jgi:uncharacterized cupredoxin-like copper-binding protein
MRLTNRRIIRFGMGTGPIAALALVAGACGGGGDGGDGAAAKPDASGGIEVVAKGMTFTPDRIIIPAGQPVTLRLRNDDTQPHDMQVSGLDAEILGGGATGPEHGEPTPMDGMSTPMDGMDTGNGGEMGPVAVHTTAGGEDEVTFIARDKGSYETWCTLPGHKDQGMVGELVVE